MIFRNMVNSNFKKLSLIICLSFFLLNVRAQGYNYQRGLYCVSNDISKSQGLTAENISSEESKHLTIMGIPITGSISSFQQKLIAKRFRLDAKSNKELPVGQREFKGYFSGHQCSLRAYYFPDDNTVYKVRVDMDFVYEQTAESAYQEIKSNLQRKYPYSDIEIGSTDGHESFHDMIIDDEDDILGFIDLIVYEGDEDPYESELVIGYTDIEGFCKEEKKHTDDL